jgi:hypothetical protein
VTFQARSGFSSASLGELGNGAASLKTLRPCDKQIFLLQDIKHCVICSYYLEFMSTNFFIKSFQEFSNTFIYFLEGGRRSTDKFDAISPNFCRIKLD